MAKIKFYAVRKGRRPGIYTRWSGTGGAEEQVKGYPGAVYKGFSGRREAETYLASGDLLTAGQQRPAEPALPGLEDAPESGSGPVRSPAAARDAYKKDLAAGKVVVFTDGASTGNPGPGGYGVVMLYGNSRKELSAGFQCTTNNRMELLACIAALRALTGSGPVIIYSDSRYVVNAVEKGWARRWQKNNWLRAPDAQGRASPAENVDLWQQMLDLLDRRPVEFRWVKGHARHPENERCDQLAVQAARGPNLLPDPGYNGRC